MCVPNYMLNTLFVCGIVPKYGDSALKRCMRSMRRPKSGVKSIYCSGFQIR